MTERGKLTGSSGDRYDEGRGKNMPDGTRPVENETRQTSSQKRETVGHMPEQQASKKEGIFADVSNVKELLNEVSRSSRDQDRVISFMLTDLKTHSMREKLEKWGDERLAMELQEWTQYTKDFYEDLHAGDSPEERSRNERIKGVVAGVRKAIVDAAQDKQAVISGSIIDEMREMRNAPVDFEAIQDRSVRVLAERIRNSLESLESRKVKDMAEWADSWNLLREMEQAADFSQDPEAKKAYFRLRDGLGHRKSEIINAMRRPQEAPPSKTTDARRRQKNHEFIYTRGDYSTEEHMNFATEMSQNYERSRAHTVEASQRDEWDRDEEVKEARRKWKEEKKKMAKLTGENGLIAELNTSDDWGKYDWSSDDKAYIRGMLGDELSGAQKDNILKGLLLQGKTAEEAKSWLGSLQAAVESDRRQDRGAAISHILESFSEDEQVWRGLGQRYGLDELAEHAEQSRERRYEGSPTNMQELAWQIAYIFPDTFGENGAHPVWERRVREVLDKKTGKYRFETHMVVNEGNVLLWQRERTNWLHSQNPNNPIDFYNEVQLEKAGFYSVNLQKMFKSEESLFRGSQQEAVPEEFMSPKLREKLRVENKTLREGFSDLSTMMQIEAYLVGMVRQFHLAYDQNKGAEGELVKQIQNLYERNHFTKEVWGKQTLWNFMTVLPDNFTELDEMDGRVGNAVVNSFLTYYHISDFDELQKRLGSDSKLFKLKEIIKVRDKLEEDRVKKAGFGARDVNSFFDFSKVKKIVDGREVEVYKNSVVNKAFNTDEEGTLKTGKEAEEAFIKLFNIFNNMEKESTLRNVVETIIMEESGDENLNGINKAYAHLISSRLVRFTGAAAENDTDFVGYDAFTRMGHFQGYRAKLLEDKPIEDEWGNLVHKNRGGDAGNIYTIPEFRRLVVNPLLGIVTEAKMKDKAGKEVEKPILMVLEDLEKKGKEITEIRKEKTHKLKMENERRPEHLRKSEEELKVLLNEMMKKYEKEYQEIAGQLHFTDNAEQSYINNQFNRGVNLYGVIRGGEQINFQDYWNYSIDSGVTFNKKKFQEDVIKKLVTNARYAFSTYKNLNYNMEIRGYDVEQKRWRNMTLGESMFGKQLVDIPEFWLAEKDENGRDIPGKWVTYKDNKGREAHVTDWEKVDANKVALFKQWLLTYFSGEFIAYRQMKKWSSDPKYEFWFYEDAIEVLSKIPGSVAYDAGDMRLTEVTSQFFTNDKLEWLREKSGTTRNKLYGLAFLKGMLVGKTGNKDLSVAGGLSDAFGSFMGAIFRGF